ncbi:MAG: FecR domain-containing protein [Spirochaetales bacterium]|nr:FecR domain-containing protein [Spirochaetales bacterium]
MQEKRELSSLMAALRPAEPAWPGFSELERRKPATVLSRGTLRRLVGQAFPLARVASLLVLPFLGIVSYLIYSNLNTGPALTEEPPGAVVLKTQGESFLLRGEERERLYAGVMIRSLDRIETAADSTVDVMMKGGLALRIRPASQLTFTGMRFQDRTDLQVDLNGGAVFLSVERLQKNDRVEVHTPTAIAGVRGTDFLVESRPGSTRVALLSGRLAVKSKSGERTLEPLQEVEVKESLEVRPLSTQADMMTQKSELQKSGSGFSPELFQQAAAVKSVRSEAELRKIYGREPDLIVLADGRELRGVVAAQHGNELIIQTVSDGTFVVSRAEVLEIRFTQ